MNKKDILKMDKTFKLKMLKKLKKLKILNNPIGFTMLLLILLCACKKKEVEQLPTAKVVKGTFYIDLYEEGEIEAVNSISVSAPIIPWRYGNLKITQLIKDGQDVNAGDTLVVFDPSEVQKGTVEAEGRLEISLAELEKLKAQHESELEELNASFEISQISQQISKIQFESAIYESDIKKKEIQLNLDKADIALVKAKEQIENRIKIQKEEIKQRALLIEQDRSRLNEAFITLNKMNVVAPSPGIGIIARNRSSNNKFQIGDQCWSGFPLIQLPDLSSLKATVRINEVDIAKITKGLAVQIKPDAFSNSIFTGVVNTVANLAVNKENSTKIKVFPVEILINESNTNLLPGLTVSCRIIMDKIDDVTFVPKEAVHLEGDKYFAFKKRGKSYEKTEVEVGATNTDYIIITKGLNKDEEVALVDPFVSEKNDNKANQKGKEE
jgi:multidrug efflux pump subunit AcrA (membrane-fusion protein)